MNINDYFEAKTAADKVASEAYQAARDARDVSDVAEARLRDANHAASIAARAVKDYARKHKIFCWHEWPKPKEESND